MHTRALAVAGAATLALAGTASAHDPREGHELLAAQQPSLNLPVVTSPNVRLLSTFPETAAISGEHAKSGPFFYVSSLDSITVFDTSDPRRPRPRGVLANLVFENEAMTYGERKRSDGTLERFVLVGNDLYNFSADRMSGPSRGRIGGGEVIVVDVTDPDNPYVRGRTPGGTAAGAVTTSTHTVQCLTTSCEYAYTAGDEGQFSVVDLRDLGAPKQVATPTSSASGPNAIFTSGSGHYWDIDRNGLAWHTGSGGAAAFSTSDPLNPTQLATTDARGVQSPYNDFIHHNSDRPNGQSFKADAAPSLANGNVLLVTEEDYANDGDEVLCDKAGSFQTWHVSSEATPGSITPLDITNPVAEFGGGLSTQIGGFCSAHWFDTHQSGIIAQGYYQQGLRFLDVRDPRNIKQYGYFTGGASEVWDAYWVPERNKNGSATGRKTNVVYTADLVRGLDVFEVTLPR